MPQVRLGGEIAIIERLIIEGDGIVGIAEAGRDRTGRAGALAFHRILIHPGG
ncbi:hypothetical protein [Methylobacterium sp. ap11]|uniref:hypothetical protein n=1 Tax=Methylobacterium sp. ap11 TaxID=1761799 RepID=UPI0015A6514A|nr:hypothetical protein [Methylobacterium sp. ap11]